MCFDDTNIETEAKKQLKQLALNEDDNKLLEMSNEILQQAKDNVQTNIVLDNDDIYGYL